ncbi:DUF1456 family protein [Dasania sp. GY-MA-18]|uniref:DUF1456 family protein n=1 Tax=Dasania phycosphaerae TaxID=2950436 RepID=A0A9J6RSG4_9GAMM|nr:MULTISPECIES: DUF1456 family protein [Dasania]MCR8924437.1 DUF1456 family protein [Dasania sp. GY-MA-18]MCZ0867112.1 DUF1456 family protein [Dasania phycosphaerae]MCZ0870564.1 DUF1456 family protein [Dasania phycosphaerae]
MTNNDVLRRIRYAFDFNDRKMIAIFALAGAEVSREQVSEWLKKEDDPECKRINDRNLATFLNGLIIEKRGKKDGPLPVPESRLNHNLVLKKLKIALNLQAEDMLEVMSAADFRMSKHELSAFFRKPDHKHYRECKDQILRHFLKGVQIKYRGPAAED